MIYFPVFYHNKRNRLFLACSSEKIAYFFNAP